ncbi:MAG: cytochrome P450, partial [Blastocatellia bacterium]|nr:cytochrome P450 [Blastocatellia bacterium]
MLVAGLLLCAALVASLPFWLPPAVVRLRMRVFTWINGEEGLPIPGEVADVSHFKEIYASPAANGRSRGAGLSDLF